MTSDEQIAQNEKVFEYCKLRYAADEARRESDAAKERAEIAELAAQDAWHACKHAPPGIYSFREMGRLAVVVDPLRDYPKLQVIR